jgi:hypothetical protein
MPISSLISHAPWLRGLSPSPETVSAAAEEPARPHGPKSWVTSFHLFWVQSGLNAVEFLWAQTNQ